VIPAIDNSEDKSPLMFLAGGPGQAAVELAAGLRHVFNEVRKTHDLILVDQRGTGQSQPFQCLPVAAQNVYTITPEEFSVADIKACINSFEGDLSQYNSENAIRDFDALRSALGHEKINIYGGSYGTRAALVYLRMFPESLRSVVLDSVGPVEVPIGLFGQSTARSFNLLLEHCQQDKNCQQAYPNLAQEFNELVSRLETQAATATIAHPRLGENTSFVISKGKLLGTLRMQLYAVASRALVPLVIHQAYLGNYRPLAGLVAQHDKGDSGQGVYIGLHFNIVCNEDFPRISEADFIKDANNNFGEEDAHFALKMACPLWPQYRPQASFYQPVTADIPTLILSGELDPVTPPSNGDISASTLPNSHHIIIDNASHTVAMNTCASDIINEFLTSLAPAQLDQSCLKDIPKESFMSSLNGGEVGEDVSGTVANKTINKIATTANKEKS